MRKDPKPYTIYFDDANGVDTAKDIDCYYCGPGETPEGLAKRLGLVLMGHKKNFLSDACVATIYADGRGGGQFFYKKA